MFGLIEKQKEFHARLSWTNTPVQETKASHKFGLLRSFRYELNRDFQNSEFLKSYLDFTYFSKTQAKETCEKGFKTMKNEYSQTLFCKTDDSDLTLNECKTPNLRDALASWTGVLVQETRACNFFFQLN